VNPNTPSDTGLLIYWYESEGVILYAKSTNDSHLKKIPLIIIDRLKENQQDSIEVQQFIELVNRAKNKGIPVDNWPGQVPVPDKEQAARIGLGLVALASTVYAIRATGGIPLLGGGGCGLPQLVK
jgi:hypothetical protein